MEHAHKLKFVQAMTKLGLQHFDGGGVISAGNSNPLSGLSGALTAQNSYQASGPDMNQVVNSQNKLGAQLAEEGAGGGPNPAQIQYQQNAQQIAQQQAAMNAQNRALNPAIAARISGNAGVNAQQNAAGNASAQQAQQQLAAQQQLNQLLAQEQNASLTGQGISAQVGQNNANAVNNTQGGLLKSIPGIGGLFGAQGGMVPHMAGGGSIQVAGVPNFSNANSLPDLNKSKSPTTAAPNTPSPFDSMDLSGSSSLEMPELGESAGVGGAAAAAPSLMEAAPLAAAANKGGNISDAPVYPSANFASGGRAGPKSFVGQWLNSKDMKANGGLMKAGGPVKASDPKEKAVVKGDSLKNDKVPAMLSEGELVVDKDTMNDPGPMGQMARALAKHIKARNGKK